MRRWSCTTVAAGRGHRCRPEAGEKDRLAPAQLTLLHRLVEYSGECAQEVLAEEDAGPEAARVGVLCVEGVVDTARRLVSELAERVAEEQRHDPLAVGLWDVEPDCCG